MFFNTGSTLTPHNCLGDWPLITAQEWHFCPVCSVCRHASLLLWVSEFFPVSLVYLSLPVFVPYYFNYCRFTGNAEVQYCKSPFFSKNFFTTLRLHIFQIKFKIILSVFTYTSHTSCWGIWLWLVWTEARLGERFRILLVPVDTHGWLEVVHWFKKYNTLSFTVPWVIFCYTFS